MHEKFSAAVFNWLRLSGVIVPRHYFDQQLQSHLSFGKQSKESEKNKLCI